MLLLLLSSANDLVVSGCGQLDTCVEFTHLQKSQLDTSQLDTTRHIRQLKSIYSAINCSALGLCSRRKATSEGRLNRKAKVVCTCIFCWSCSATMRHSLMCHGACHVTLLKRRSFRKFRPSRFSTILLQWQILMLILGRACCCWLCSLQNSVSSLCSTIHVTCVSSNYSSSCFNWIVRS